MSYHRPEDSNMSEGYRPPRRRHEDSNMSEGSGRRTRPRGSGRGYVGIVMATNTRDGKRVAILQLPRHLDGRRDIRVVVDGRDDSHHSSKVAARNAFHAAVKRHGGPRR